ncbi:MFS transporter [Pseudonocardia lacus]|uniref:MFS transporter n=1 Tax=Pseudonocardia lacus TaxID=2835865 RepID=UPI001BDD879B|nr:MFS transporter [Pseudonocardia lacus]
MSVKTEPAGAEQARTLGLAAAGTVLAMIAYTTPLATLASTATGLGAGPDAQAWILSSMSVGLAVALLPAGAVGDDHGRRRMFATGALVLAAASVLAALAPGAGTLVAARVGQGLGAAAILACSLGLIGHAFPAGPLRLRATGVWGAAVGVGIAVGPLAAAGLDTAVGWRGPHWLIAVLAAPLAWAAHRLLAESRGDRRQRVDLPGALLLGGALTALLAGLVEVRLGWGPAVVALLGGGALLAVAFVLVELRRPAPMLDLRLFARPDFTGAAVAAVATGAGIIALMSFMPTLLQRGYGHGALYAAVLLLAWSATSAVTALLARRLPARFGARAQLAAGLLGVGIGQAMLTGLDAGAGAARMLPGLLVAGAASGVLNAALARQAVASAPVGLAGVGSGTNNTARYLGAAVGVTIVAVLAAHPEPAAMVAGWNAAALVTAAVSVVGAVVVLLVRPRRVPRDAGEPRSHPQRAGTRLS